MNKEAPIGIFDSGVGGISVLGRLTKLLPRENYIYYADTARFPYGDKSCEVVKAGVLEAAATMAEHGIKMLVVACNTATAAAIEDLRAKYDFPVLGIEPALKPAVEAAAGKSVALIATSLTLKEKKFRQLFEAYREKGEIVNLEAPGLADLVENGHYRDEAARAYLSQLFDGVKADTVVLGCTHYLFLWELIREFFPAAEIIDGGSGLARNVCRTLMEQRLLKAEGEGSMTVLSSAEASFLPRFDSFFQDILSILALLSHKMS
ncbi:MAG TPA: glutamate racemase [Clostridiales bacterium]|nr:glutamate racemase [Clostridiales bacterium]